MPYQDEPDGPLVGWQGTAVLNDALGDGTEHGDFPIQIWSICAPGEQHKRLIRRASGAGRQA